ncbi:ABC transporter permease [Bifidobacterium pullorum subsp. saeculare]|uniref:ABC transporter permease n=1 Tax=Bifidobacterium pullorum subsp. saeculare TaxID=78257 RepID=A0A938WVI1_9BIFI|nr:ABC transporter permease [Bifidobacterium pullorum]MBM6698776.1 ABC transporter permease [Bifidobacterium pullorum subsp. saeculare]
MIGTSKRRGSAVRGGPAVCGGRAARAAGAAGRTLYAVWSRGGGRAALIVIGVWTAVALVSLVWTPWPLLATDGYHTWQAPSPAHPLGTDGTGADVLSWLMAGAATDLAIALLVALVAAVWGTLLIAAMVSRHGALAGTAVVAVDALISIPTVLLALILAVPLGASVAVVVCACGFAYGLNLARIARPAALLAARSAYVESALANGASGMGVLIRHILPNSLPVIAVQLSMSAGTALLAEAGLTYLGVGVPSGVPSWGHSLTTSVRFVTVYPAAVLWPGLVVTVAVVALNLLGDALRDATDPAAVGSAPPADAVEPDGTGEVRDGR